jgi:hypothetical protein
VPCKFAGQRPANRCPPLSAELVLKFSWSQLQELVRLDDPLKRAFYENECLKGNWSVRQPRVRLALPRGSAQRRTTPPLPRNRPRPRGGPDETRRLRGGTETPPGESPKDAKTKGHREVPVAQRRTGISIPETASTCMNQGEKPSHGVAPNREGGAQLSVWQAGGPRLRNPEGFNLNSRGCNPRKAGRSVTALKGPNPTGSRPVRPFQGRHFRPTMSAGGRRSHPRLFMWQPSGLRGGPTEVRRTDLRPVINNPPDRLIPRPGRTAARPQTSEPHPLPPADA